MTSLQSIRQQLDSGDLSMVGVVEYYLHQIKQSRDLNIYIEIYREEALSAAERLDAKRAAGEEMGALYGIVASIKDVLCYQDHQVTAGSHILDGFESQFTATSLERALAEDMIIIGRTNCDEFAMGSSNENSYYGPTFNGIDPDRVPGGSSGAAAVSVQMDTCLVAFGSDTGGSVRQPAAFCGVYGYKPTYGRISRYGLIAYASSFDQIGLLSKDVSAIRETLSVVEGQDQMDSTSADLASIESTAPQKTYKIAYFEHIADHPAIAPAIREAFQDRIEQLRAAGHEVVPVSFDLIDYLVPTYYVLTTAEASSNLHRFDGVRYGHQAKDAHDIHELYAKSRSEGFGTEVKRRIMMGTFVLSVGYFDAYFNKAQQVRALLTEQIKTIFAEHDFILMPTTPDVAWRVGEKVDDPLEMYLSDIFTVLANLCGLPAISIPNGVHEGLSHGIQLLARQFDDDRLIDFSASL